MGEGALCLRLLAGGRLVLGLVLVLLRGNNATATTGAVSITAGVAKVAGTTSALSGTEVVGVAGATAVTVAVGAATVAVGARIAVDGPKTKGKPGTRAGVGPGSSDRTEILPCTTLWPSSDCTSTAPPLGPLASITLDGLSTTDCLARSVTLPFSPTTALLAWIVPLLRTSPP